jgi:hypothetical protein
MASTPQASEVLSLENLFAGIYALDLPSARAYAAVRPSAADSIVAGHEHAVEEFLALWKVPGADEKKLLTQFRELVVLLFHLFSSEPQDAAVFKQCRAFTSLLDLAKRLSSVSAAAKEAITSDGALMSLAFQGVAVTLDATPPLKEKALLLLECAAVSFGERLGVKDPWGKERQDPNYNPLCAESMKGSIPLIIFAIEKGFDRNFFVSSESAQFAPLSLAFERGHAEAFEFLLPRSDLTRICADGRSLGLELFGEIAPPEPAATELRKAVLRSRLDAICASGRRRCCEAVDVLGSAVSNCSLEVVQEVLKAGGRLLFGKEENAVNATPTGEHSHAGHGGYSSLIGALLRQDLDILSLLVEHHGLLDGFSERYAKGSKEGLVQALGDFAVSVAGDDRGLALLDRLLAATVDPFWAEFPRSGLVGAIYGRDEGRALPEHRVLALLQRFRSYGHNTHFFNEETGQTLAHCAAEAGHAEVLQWAIDTVGCPADSFYWREEVDGFFLRESPLTCALINRRRDVAALLIEKYRVPLVYSDPSFREEDQPITNVFGHGPACSDAMTVTNLSSSWQARTRTFWTPLVSLKRKNLGTKAGPFPAFSALVLISTGPSVRSCSFLFRRRRRSPCDPKG